MTTRTKMKLIGASVAALAVAGGGVAIAATKAWSPKEERQAVLDDAAKQLGVTPTQLSDALKQALKNRVDDALAAGRVTQAQADELKKRIDSSDFPFPLGFLGLGPGHEEFGHLGPFGSLGTAGSYLGLTEAELRSQLAQGKTLAEIAKDRGKSVDGLVQALVKVADDKIDAAVDSGKLTKSQAEDLKADLKERITDLVNGGLSFDHGFGFHRPGSWFRGPGNEFRHPDFMPGFRGFYRGRRAGPSA